MIHCCHRSLVLLIINNSDKLKVCSGIEVTRTILNLKEAWDDAI